jgi:hypothetical protein
MNSWLVETWDDRLSLLWDNFIINKLCPAFGLQLLLIDVYDIHSL